MKLKQYVRLVLFLLLINCATKTYAQVFGGNPSSVKWKQLNTQWVKIIFPDGTDSTAQQIAASTSYLQQQYPMETGGSFKKINILLQTETTISNAYVSLGPWRSEFYLMPPQNPFELSAQNWANLLAVHEFRHIQQYNEFNTGNAKLAGALFGQYGRATANAAAIPDWFFEGDAVYNETRLSSQGRGKLPAFFNGYKSILADSSNYKYMQLRNGSYRNFIPDHYQLGYLLVLYGIEKYGEDFWQPILKEAAALKTFYPLQSAMKKTRGIEFDAFAKEALQYFKTTWQNENNNDPGNLEIVSKLNAMEPNNRIINYQYPYAINADTFICYKNTLQDIPAFYLKTKSGFEKKVAVKDIAVDDYFSYNNGQVVYAARQPDARWGNRDFTYIKVLNIYSKKESIVASKGKYFSPDIAHKKELVVAVDMKNNNSSRLVLFDIKGVLIKEFSNTKNYIYSFPKFSANDDKIFVIVRDNAGNMGIQSLDKETGTPKEILPMANRTIGFPVVKGDTITYSCSYQGRDVLMALNISSKESSIIATNPTGIYQGIFLNNNEIVAAVFTVHGYQLAAAKPMQKRLSPAADALQMLYSTNKSLQKNSITPLPASSNNLPVEKYKKATGLFNFHSWLPSLDDPNYSLTFYGENVLNTMQTQLGYNYNRFEKSHETFYKNVYGGWYLQPFASANYTFNRSFLYGPDSTVKWNEAEARVGLQLPLNFTKGKMFQFAFLSSSMTVNNRQYDNFSKALYNDRNVIYSDSRINYSIFKQRAPQQVLPQFGFSVSLRSRHALNTVANNFTGTVVGYFPGLAKTHSLSFNYSYLHRDTLGNFYFSKIFPFSRGYNYAELGRLSKFGVNYQFPLCYPDFGFGNLVFINRIRVNGFAESTKGRNQRTDRVLSYKTIGAEMFFDTKWYNQQQLTFGIRYNYLLNAEMHDQPSSVIEFILPVIINP